MRTILVQLAVAAVFILGSLSALGQDVSYSAMQPGATAMPPYGPPGVAPSAVPVYGPPVVAQPPLPPVPSGDGIAWPPPGGRLNAAQSPYDTVRPAVPVLTGSATSLPAEPALAAPVIGPAATERCLESTIYYRLDAFSWNERGGGADLVNESGPLSTLGYLRRNGYERFRFELFGGTVSYDGAAQYDDGTTEPYHMSYGTDYLGLRAEYDLLIEPAAWSRVRLVLGAGTRFWVRDLQNAITPSGNFVLGYEESWWTFYPYLGLETKESADPGLQFFGSARIGVTPLTYQYATYFDTVAWPRCGLTGRLELGARFHRVSLSAVAEIFTWQASAATQDGYGDISWQPDSRMVTIGGQLGYTF